LHLRHQIIPNITIMKHKNLIAALLISSLIITACGSESAEQQTETQSVTLPSSTTTLPQTNTPATIQNNPTDSRKPVAPSIGTNQQPLNTAATTAGLNPAHGQPGHRCEIAVGAPLNSAPTTPQQPVITTTAKPTTVATPVVSQINPVQPAVTSTATGLNPEHGKPGHRCDISVGAPLNSKPAQQPTVVQQPAIVQQPAVTIPPQKTYVSEVQKSTPATITAPSTAIVAEGMNPEHGKPGHRCDIAVGAPLNSKPKQ